MVMEQSSLEQGTSDAGGDCHHFYCLVTIFDLTHLFQTFLTFIFSRDWSPPMFTDSCLLLFHVSYSYNHMAKRSHHHIMIFSTSEFIILWTCYLLFLLPLLHLHYHLNTHHPSQTRQGQSVGECDLDLSYGEEEGLQNMVEDYSLTRPSTAMVSWVLPSKTSVQQELSYYWEPSPD